MGALTDALAAAARTAVADLVIVPFHRDRNRRPHSRNPLRRARRRWARHVLVNAAPHELSRLLGRIRPQPRNPRAPSSKKHAAAPTTPAARCGRPARGVRRDIPYRRNIFTARPCLSRRQPAVPCPPPRRREIYCHTLTDPSILGEVPAGTHTLTYFGLHLPATLFADPATRAERKELAVARAIASLDRAPGRPDRVGRRPRRRRPALHRGQDPAGRRGGPADARRPYLPWRPELAVGGRRGRAGHARGALGRRLPAGRTCCSAARAPVRGGAVSGLGGHNAAQAVLELA